MNEDLENLEGLENDEFDGLIELTDEDGNTEQYELLASFPVGDDQYLAVAEPMEEEEPESVEVFFLKVEEDEDGNEVYVSVDDDKVDAVYEEFLKVVEAQDDEG